MRHRTVKVAELFKDDKASQWKSEKFDPRCLRNPKTYRRLNVHRWLCRGPLLLCKISFRYDYLLLPPLPLNMRRCDNARQVTRLVFCGSSFSLQPTATTPAPIFTIKWHRFAQVCAFLEEGPETKILHFNLTFPPRRKFLAKFWLDLEHFASKRR